MRLILLLLLLAAACGPHPEPPAAAPGFSLPPGARDSRSAAAAEAARQGRPDEALAQARRFVAEEPENAEAWAVLAALLESMGRQGEATEAAARAVDLDPRWSAVLVEARMRGDSGAALETARAFVERDPQSAAARQALAEALLYHAAAAQAEGGRDAATESRAAREARKEAEVALRRAGSPGLRAEALATLGNSWYLEGDLVQAGQRYREALAAGLPPARAVDVAQTLAWIAFLEGDRKACGQWLHRALREVSQGPLDATGLIPRWEYLQMQLWAFAGEEVDPADVEAREPVYERLRQAGMVDHFEYRTTRDMMRQVARLREQGQYHEAIKVLYDDPYGDDLERVDEEGETRPRSFVSEAVERDQEETLFNVLRAELAREARDWNAAHHWYEEALRLAPDNPILKKRMASLP